MTFYRFAGVKKAPEAKTTEQCCEPVCGPTTCGTSAEAQEEQKTEVKAAKKRTAKDQCCEPECGPSTCP